MENEIIALLITDINGQSKNSSITQVIAPRTVVTRDLRLQCQVVMPLGCTDKNSILAARKRTMQRKEKKKKNEYER